MNNTGNDDFLKINITGADLISTTTSDTISAASFYINSTNRSAAGGNNFGLALSSTSAIAIPGNPADGTAPNATLIHGPGISGDSVPYADADTKDKGNRSIYFWVNVPAGKASATYNNTWNITVINSAGT